MSRLGKSFKNRFLRRALAMVLAGTMVLSKMPVSFAAEALETETMVETEVQGETEEAAEDKEVEQKEPEETDSGKITEETETVSKGETTVTESDRETETTATEVLETTTVIETEETETDAEETEEEENGVSNTSTYGATEGDDEALVKYNLEGFANSYGVTGGGLLKPENDSYYTATNEKEFLDAILAARNARNHAPVVIEITKDMNLGDAELEKTLESVELKEGETQTTFADYSRVIAKHAMEPLMHPTLRTTGVSMLTIQDTENLTIFSQNGSSIKHCAIQTKRAKNIIIRNITFDELWEWDEGGTNGKNEPCKPGDYDRNDWDYLCIDQDCDGIWIDHCTFYKAYDGIIDVKNPADNGKERVTISWCEFLPASELIDGKPKFFDEQMTYLKEHVSENKYYKALTSNNASDSFTFTDKDGKTETLKAEGFSDEQVRMYAYGQKKTHLFGQGDSAKNAVGIRVTLANNNYNNSMDRMPRLRYGRVHEYNCIMDASKIYAAKQAMNGTSHIVSNGASSTCRGEILLENCYIKDIKNALNSGNGSSPMGYIKAINSKYIFDDKEESLAPTNNTSNENDKGKDPLITDEAAFKSALPYYGYTLYEASSLDSNVAPNAGAGKITLNEVQWEKTSYGTRDGYGTKEEGKYGSETGETDPPTEEEIGDDFSLSADDFTVGTITAGTKKNGFTIISALDVDAESPKEIKGVQYTNRIKLGGTGSESSRSIHFTAAKPGVLTVYAISSSSSADRQLGLYKVSVTTATDTKTALGASPSILEYSITETGDYYIKSEASGINIYYIAFKSGAAGDGETDPKNPPAGYEDSTILNANDLVAEEITKSIELNDHYTLVGTADGAVTIKEITETTINEKPFTKAIGLSGSGSASKSAIAVTVPKAGKLAVYASETLILENASNEQQESASTISKVTDYTVGAAGTYYLYSSTGSSDVYYIEFTEQTQEPPEGMITNTFEFRVNSLNNATLTEDLPIGDYFTVTTTSVIEAKSATINEVSFSKCVKFGGKGDTTGKSIQIKALGKGKITVYAQSGSSEERKVAFLNSEGKNLESPIGVTSTATAITFNIPEKGIYYITSGGSSIFIYGIDLEVTYKEGESFDDEEGETEGTTFVAPEGDIEFGADEGNDSTKIMYNMEGYAAAANVTGGGLLKEDSDYYWTVENEKDFLEALQAVRNEPGKPHVIEVTNDLNLGSIELKEKYGFNIVPKGDKTGTGHYTGVIRRFTEIPKMHPTLKKTGVSYLSMNGFKNLTIFSKNGAMIKHAGIKMEGTSQNIIIRNLVFDELWEWDEGGKDSKGDDCAAGDYDINDWDYFNIEEDSEGIWIDHCTFYKSYDGLIDLKNKQGYTGYQRVTISWCEFLPGSKDNVFFNEQMKWLEDNIDNEEINIPYYRQLRKENMKAPNADKTMSAKDVWWYVYGQKKAHLLGSSDGDTQDKAIRVTFANNYYKNANSRLPRLRYGKVHEYNCVFDSQQMNDQYEIGNPHITGNGAISTCGGEMLLENCYIRGVRTPLRSGYKGPGGYINAVGSVYYLDNSLKTLEVKDESTDGLKITDKDKFKEKLTYNDYILYDATQLYTNVVPYAGAGKLDMSTVQWEKTKYGSRAGNEGSETSASPSQTEPAIPSEYDKAPTTPWDTPDNPDDPDDPSTETVAAPTASPANEAEFPSTGGEITLDCTTNGAAIYYTISETEAGLTDPADKTNTGRVPYTAGTKIPITKETYIWAVAVKGDKTSDPLKCHYTVAAEGAVPKPFATPNPATPVTSGTKVTLSITGEADAIYYTKGATPDAAADPTKEDSGREIYNNETGIVITEAVTIKAVAKKGNKYSDVAAFAYTLETDIPGDEQKVETPKANPDPAKGAVAIGTNVTLTCASENAIIYYTLDGTDPTVNSTRYGNPIAIPKPKTETVTIKAFAVKDGWINSEIAKFEYTVKRGIQIEGLKESYAYTGAKIIPDIDVVDYDDGEKLLVPGVDYTVAYKNNTKPTTAATVTVTGKGNYKGKDTTQSFEITEAASGTVDVKGAKIAAIPNKEYNKTAQYPDFTLTLKGQTSGVIYTNPKQDGVYKRQDGADMDVNVAVSNNVNKGTATILVSGSDNTSVKKTFKITAVDISQSDNITVDPVASVEYAVKGAVPKSLVVKDGDKILKSGRDYTVKYSNNKKKGTGNITITGKGNYTKKYSKTVTYGIDQLDLSKIEVSAVTAYSGIKASKVKATVVDGDGTALKASQYTLEIYIDKDGSEKYNETDTLESGTEIYVAAIAKDTTNLSGKTKITKFKVGEDISKAKVVVKAQEYTGGEIELTDEDLEVTLKGVSGNLKMSEDYEVVAYSNNINKGTATAVIRGINDYSGTKTIKFKITQKTMKIKASDIAKVLNSMRDIMIKQ